MFVETFAIREKFVYENGSENRVRALNRLNLVEVVRFV